MEYRINCLPAERLLLEGTDTRVMDFPFHVSKSDGSNRVVRVRFIGSRPGFLTKDGKWEDMADSEILAAAEALLHHRLKKGTCDPFSRPETDSILELCREILEHWKLTDLIPPHL